MASDVGSSNLDFVLGLKPSHLGFDAVRLYFDQTQMATDGSQGAVVTVHFGIAVRHGRADRAMQRMRAE
ncbi:MAG: hypothetical protein L0Z07_02610 [Planctomycetes bacterium]|jgi:hypothetical protein|nr:hypothetical protein [Planctomycetota bacterium]